MSYVDNVTVVKFSKSRVWPKFQTEVPVFMEVPKFPYNTVWDRRKEAFMPTTSSSPPVVSIQYRLVTDR